MANINWQELLFGSESADFLWEVFVRTAIMYIFILVALRSSGRRGVKQLSIFETVIIIGLGSAAGDPMFYKEVGLAFAALVFVVLIGLYRATTYFSSRFRFLEEALEGKPQCLVQDGRFVDNGSDREHLSQDEFFAELRMCNVEHLGQVRQAILETSGEVSLLYFEEDDVRPGLPLLLGLYDKRSSDITSEKAYACTACGNVQTLDRPAKCQHCGHDKWVEAINTKRIS